MAIRLTDTNRHDEDWYIELGGEYQSLWDYICDTCDNAGVWKPNKSGFEMRKKFRVNLDSFFEQINQGMLGGTRRVELLKNGRWFIPNFIRFQWFNKKSAFDLILTNHNHKSIYNSLVSNSVPLVKVRGLREVLQRAESPPNNSNSNGIKDKEGMGEEGKPATPMKWKTKPGEAEVENLVLTKNEIAKAEEYYHRMVGAHLTPDQVINFWQAFKIQQFNGVKSYSDKEDCLQHFRYWIKGKNPVTNQSNGRKQNIQDERTRKILEEAERARK